MQSEDNGDWVMVHHRVGFADCDPARIAYTGSLVQFALVSIEEFWRIALRGPSWYELLLDHGIGTPFVNIEVRFSAPVTPRADLQVEVRVSDRSNRSVTFGIVARQDDRMVFSGRFVCAFVMLETMSSIAAPDMIRTALDRFRA